jgi:hypothetical protein
MSLKPETVACINTIDDLRELMTPPQEGEKPSIEVSYIDHYIAGTVDNRWLQLMPYVGIYAFDKDTGELHTLSYESVVYDGNIGVESLVHE